MMLLVPNGDNAEENDTVYLDWRGVVGYDAVYLYWRRCGRLPHCISLLVTVQ